MAPPALSSMRLPPGYSLRGVPMRRRSLAVTTALICTVMLLGGPKATTLRAAADADAADGGRRSFWLEQGRGPPYRDPGRRISGHATADAGRRLRRTSAGSAAEKGGCQGEREEPFRDRVPLGARVVDGRGPDVQRRRLSLRRQRLVHGVGRRLEAIVQGRPRPRRPCRFQWASRGPSPERRSTRRRPARSWPTRSFARRASPHLAPRSPR